MSISRKRTILSLSLVLSASFLLTGCPHHGQMMEIASKYQMMKVHQTHIVINHGLVLVLQGAEQLSPMGDVGTVEMTALGKSLVQQALADLESDTGEGEHDHSQHGGEQGGGQGHDPIAMSKGLANAVLRFAELTEATGADVEESLAPENSIHGAASQEAHRKLNQAMSLAAQGSNLVMLGGWAAPEGLGAAAVELGDRMLADARELLHSVKAGAAHSAEADAEHMADGAMEHSPEAHAAHMQAAAGEEAAVDGGDHLTELADAAAEVLHILSNMNPEAHGAAS